MKYLIKNQKKIDYKKWIKENDFTWKRHAQELIRVFSKKCTWEDNLFKHNQLGDKVIIAHGCREFIFPLNNIENSFI